MDFYYPKRFHIGVIFPALANRFPAFAQCEIFRLCFFGTSLRCLEVKCSDQHHHNSLRDSVRNAAGLYPGKLENQI